MKTVIAQLTLGLLAATAITIPAQAQDEAVDNEQVEQGLFDDVGKILKDVGKTLGCGLAREVPVIGEEIAGAVKCNEDRDDSETEVTPQDVEVEPTAQVIPAGELRPSLTVSIVKITGEGENLAAKAATPDTVYEAGSGFAMILQNTAPGYLEIWSVDEEASYIEGALLPEAGALVLPASVQGLYRLTGDSPEDYVRFRFFPCEPQAQQGFELEANQKAAELSDRAAEAIAKLSARLPTCSFGGAQISAAIAAKEPQDELFRTALTQRPTFDTEQSAYVIDTNRVRPMDALIELKRR